MKTDNKTSHLKNIINNIITVKVKTAKRDHLFLNILVAQCFSIQFRHAALAAKDKLLNQQLNATLHKYTDTTQLLDKGRRSRKKV